LEKEKKRGGEDRSHRLRWGEKKERQLVIFLHHVAKVRRGSLAGGGGKKENDPLPVKRKKKTRGTLAVSVEAQTALGRKKKRALASLKNKEAGV